MKSIISKDNALIKSFVKLKTKKGRLKAGQYIIDGYRIVQHAIDCGADIKYVLVSDEFLDNHNWDYDTNVIKIPMHIMKTIVETETPQGIAAIISVQEKVLKPGPILFLDQVQDPGNLGTLIRTADAAGFGGVMLRKGCTDPFSQKSLRSSMGSIMSIPVQVNADLEDLVRLQRPLYGAALEGGVSYKTVTYDNESVLIIGNEGNGISKEVLDCVTKRIYIPMKGDVESLNASIAGGILMFEISSCTS